MIHDIGKFTTEDVKTGLNNMCLCVEMLMIAYAHKWAFPYEEFKGQAPALDGNSENNTMTRNLLSDNFALTDTVRDFNESKLLPNIVLPTGFVPGKGVEQAKKVPRVGSSKISKKKTNEEIFTTLYFTAGCIASTRLLPHQMKQIRHEMTSANE